MFGIGKNVDGLSNLAGAASVKSFLDFRRYMQKLIPRLQNDLQNEIQKKSDNKVLDIDENQII